MKYLQSTLIACSLAIFSLTTPVSAQTGDEAASLEEIVVTGRKRDESLIDVPVSISVWSAESLADQGIQTQEELFQATANLDYTNWAGNRNQNNPGIRGVQSDLRALNQQKVASFVDGQPMQGNQGSLQFSGIDNVEVYRGPQSAAFGRSTFAGAINYVTSDSTEEFTGKVQVRLSDLGDKELGALLSGPLGDNMGYRLSYIKNEWSGPDDWTATDGTETGKEQTDLFTGKLNFQFSDTAYGEVMYVRNYTDDVNGPSWISDPATCDAGSGIWRFNMGTDVELPGGEWNCPADVPNGAMPRNRDVLGQFLDNYDANIGFYTAAAMGADANMDGVVSSDEYLAQRFADGQTYEQALQGQTLSENFWRSERDRIQGELNFEIGEGLLQIMGMYSEETNDFWMESDHNNTQAAFAVNMMTMLTSLGANVMSMANMNSLEEKYAEIRWVSPGEERLRYTLSGSYYGYDSGGQLYNNYGALFYGLTTPNGSPVDAQPGISITENATNYGASFGVQYDISDATTLSFEGRYQVDDVCGVDTIAGTERCTDTTAFLPRIALSTSFADNRTAYVQASVGNNPAGINIWSEDPGNIQALQVANGSIPSPADGFTYDGSDGVHFPTVDYDADTWGAFEEEKLYNFEIGSKGIYADGRGSYSAALYYMIWENMIGAENLNWDDTEVNGWNEANWTTFTGERTWINQGDSEMYGFEITTDFAINDVWTAGGYLTLSSAKFSDYCSIQAPQYRDAPGAAGGGGNFIVPILTPAADGVPSSCGVVDGNWLPRQSPMTANLNISATLPNPVFGMRTNFRMDVRHKGSFYEDHMNKLERKPVTTVNVSANMRNENWNLRFFINNLFDENEPQRISPQNYRVTPANPSVAPPNNGSWSIVPRRPREIGVTMGYQF